MRFRGRRAISAGNIEDPFSTCIGDLMAGLLSIFILALVYFILNFTQARAQLVENDVKLSQMLTDIQFEMKARGIEIKIDPSHGVLTLPEGVLFDVGEADLKAKGKVIINVLGDVLYKVLLLQEYKGSVETIFIEGHTDNVPIKTAKYPSNWELSTQRAINTWLNLDKTHNKLNDLKNKKGQKLFSCSGYADMRPVNSNATQDGRKDNRRIAFRFSMTPPTTEDAKIIKTIKKNILPKS